MTSYLSEVHFVKDDFIPESVISCTGHTVVAIKEVYFYACWMTYKRIFSKGFQVQVSWPYITIGTEKNSFQSQVPSNPEGFMQHMNQSSKGNRSQDICVT